MNTKRGLLRAWVVAAVLWWGTAAVYGWYQYYQHRSDVENGRFTWEEAQGDQPLPLFDAPTIAIAISAPIALFVGGVAAFWVVAGFSGQKRNT